MPIIAKDPWVPLFLWLRSHKQYGRYITCRELKFCEGRQWRADLAFPEIRLLVELDGGVWTNGRHVRARGFEDDLEKLNAASLLAWKVLRFTPAMIRDGYAFAVLESLLVGGKVPRREKRRRVRRVAACGVQRAVNGWIGVCAKEPSPRASGRRGRSARLARRASHSSTASTIRRRC